ncbi:hypothetical protein SAMN06265375_102313 [Muriicola jejuensis]|nr:hypothetical protein SAMN06265375_102313 [Muriicola jejuensis]
MYSFFWILLVLIAINIALLLLSAYRKSET